jgi:hypothetical protein
VPPTRPPLCTSMYNYNSASPSMHTKAPIETRLELMQIQCNSCQLLQPVFM